MSGYESEIYNEIQFANFARYVLSSQLWDR